MPLFAFANAGVTFGFPLEGAGGRVTLAIILALVVGKPLGISLLTPGGRFACAGPRVGL